MRYIIKIKILECAYYVILSDVGIGTGTNMNSEKPYTYDTVDSLHPSGIYEQVGAAKESQRKYDLYDKLPPTRKVRQYDNKYDNCKLHVHTCKN